MDQAEIISSRLEFPLLDDALLAAFIERRLDDAARLLAAELEPGWPDTHDENFLRGRLDDRARDGAMGPWGGAHVPWCCDHRRAE